jgi:hypothetical protein
VIPVQSYKDAAHGNGQGSTSVAERPAQTHVADAPSTSGRQAS